MAIVDFSQFGCHMASQSNIVNATVCGDHREAFHLALLKVDFSFDAQVYSTGSLVLPISTMDVYHGIT